MTILSLYETFNNYINQIYGNMHAKLTQYNDDFKPSNIYFIRHGHSCSNLLKENLKIKNTNITPKPKAYEDYKIKSKSLPNKLISSLAKKHTLITNPNLSGLGSSQAQELKNSVLSVFNNSNSNSTSTSNELIVFCSPLVRAMETAQIAFPNRTISYEYYYFNNNSISNSLNLNTEKIYILPFIKELGITPDNALPNIEESNTKFKTFMNKYNSPHTYHHNYNRYNFNIPKQETKVKKTNLKLITKKIKTFFSRTKKKPSSSSNQNTSPLLNTQKDKFLSFLKKVNKSDTHKLIFVSHSNFIKSIIGKENITSPNNKIKNTMIIDIHGNIYNNNITDTIGDDLYHTCISETKSENPKSKSEKSSLNSSLVSANSNTENNDSINFGPNYTYNGDNEESDDNEESEPVELSTSSLRKPKTRNTSKPKLSKNSSAPRKPKKSLSNIQLSSPQLSLRTQQSINTSSTEMSPLLRTQPLSLSPVSQSPVTKSSLADVTPTAEPALEEESSAASGESAIDSLNNETLKKNINSLFKTKPGDKFINIEVTLGNSELTLTFNNETRTRTIKYDKLSILNPMSKNIIKRHIGSDPNSAKFSDNIKNMIAKSNIFYNVLELLKEDKTGGTRKKLRNKQQHEKTKKL